MYEPDISYEEFIKKEQEKYPELNLDDIETLKKKVEANKDIHSIRDKMLVMFLHASHFNVDTAYKMIVNNYKYRKELWDLFSSYDPTSEDMKQVFNTITMGLLMNVITGKEERIIVTDFKNTDPKQYNYEQSTKYFNMLFEYIMATQGTFDGLIIVMNSKGLNWRHVYKTPMNKMKKMLGLVQEGLPVRLKEVHILNAGSTLTLLFNLIKPFMNNGLMDIVRIHPENATDIFDKVPIDLMPVEIGGTGKSHFDINDDTYKLLVSSRDWFLSLD